MEKWGGGIARGAWCREQRWDQPHLQDQLAQAAFVLSQCLGQGSHLGQGFPLLHSLRLQPGHEQFQVGAAGLGLGQGGGPVTLMTLSDPRAHLLPRQSCWAREGVSSGRGRVGRL